MWFICPFSVLPLHPYTFPPSSSPRQMGKQSWRVFLQLTIPSTSQTSVGGGKTLHSSEVFLMARTLRLALFPQIKPELFSLGYPLTKTSSPLTFTRLMPTHIWELSCTDNPYAKEGTFFFCREQANFNLSYLRSSALLTSGVTFKTLKKNTFIFPMLLSEFFFIHQQGCWALGRVEGSIFRKPRSETCVRAEI